MAVNRRVQEATKGAVLNGREPLVADKWRSMGKGGGWPKWQRAHNFQMRWCKVLRKRWYEGLREARVVSPFSRVFTGRFVLGFCFFCFICTLVWIDGENNCFELLFHFFYEFLVVDRQCSVLARQCRKKKKVSWHCHRLEERKVCQPQGDLSKPRDHGNRRGLTSCWTGMCWQTGCTQWLPPGSQVSVSNCMCCYSTDEEKAHRGPDCREVEAWWE